MVRGLRNLGPGALDIFGQKAVLFLLSHNVSDQTEMSACQQQQNCFEHYAISGSNLLSEIDAVMISPNL